MARIDRYVSNEQKLIARTFRSECLNAIVNHPDVRPFVGGGVADIDLSSAVVSPLNIAFEMDGGGFLLVNQGMGRYEVHSFVLPRSRGEACARAMRQGLDYVFTRTDAVEIVTRVPNGNIAASALAKAAHFKSQFTMPIDIQCSGMPEDTTVYSLNMDTWAWHSDICLSAGRWFHDVTEPFLSEEPHADCDVHHKAAGAAVLMCLESNSLKARDFYNRWASTAGYHPIAVLNEHPIQIDYGTMIVEIDRDGAEVLLCR